MVYQVDIRHIFNMKPLGSRTQEKVWGKPIFIFDPLEGPRACDPTFELSWKNQMTSAWAAWSQSRPKWKSLQWGFLSCSWYSLTNTIPALRFAPQVKITVIHIKWVYDIRKIFGFFEPLPTCLHLELIYTTYKIHATSFTAVFKQKVPSADQSVLTIGRSICRLHIGEILHSSGFNRSIGFSRWICF